MIEKSNNAAISKIKWDLPPLAFDGLDCSIMGSVNIKPTTDLDLAQDILLRWAFTEAHNFVYKSCQRTKHSNIGLTLLPKGKSDGPRKGEFWTRSVPGATDGPNWGEYRNAANYERQREIDRHNEELEQKRRADRRAEQERLRTERRERLIAQLSTRVEAYLAGRRPVENIADLMEYDRLRALQALASGLDIQIIMTEPEFRDGKFIVSNRQQAFDIEAAVSEGQFFNMEDFFRRTQNPFAGQFKVVCIFEADSIGNMTDGEPYVVRAKMTHSTGSQVVLECRR